MTRSLFVLIFLLMAQISKGQLYFPPIGTGSWDTLSPNRLGWCSERIDTLYNYLEAKNTKAFLVLKDGKIVLEKYFGTFTADSNWYWASAGKSLASAVVSIAENEGFLSINDPVSDYLGKGWTSCPADKEALITIKHQITMTTGLNENLSNSDCTDPACLTYKADAGSRWFYNNAPYTLVHDVVATATGKSFNLYTYQKLSSKIGMGGLWIKTGENDIFFSKARDMARFGILIQNKGLWNGDSILKNNAYVQAMSNTSQSLNKSYGYLWWLNGKGEIVFPGLENVFKRDLVPTAPADLFAALGKNDQKLYIVPSEGLTVVRMGDAADAQMPAISDFDLELWALIQKLACSSSGVKDVSSNATKIYPNPTSDYIHIESKTADKWILVNHLGQSIADGVLINGAASINLKDFPSGFYLLNMVSASVHESFRFVKTSLPY